MLLKMSMTAVTVLEKDCDTSFFDWKWKAMFRIVVFTNRAIKSVPDNFSMKTVVYRKVKAK